MLYVIIYRKLRINGEIFMLSDIEIAQEAKKQLDFDIDKKKIVLDEPIRTLGTHVIQIKLHKDVTAKMNVKVQEA